MKDGASSPRTLAIGDFEVCRMGFGAMQLPGPMVWGEPADPGRARAVLRRAVELGVQLIDTSWYYGPLVANRLIAETLHPYPKDLVIATKLGGMRTPDKGWAPALRPEELRRGCEEDLRTLRLERLDVVHLRCIGHAPVPFAESLGAMIDLQKEGKIRHIGLSNVSLDQLAEATAKTPVVTVQNLYNVVAGERRILDSHVGLVKGQEALVDHCAAKGIAFLPFFPLAIPGATGREKGSSPALAAVAKAHAATETQIALAWLLARSPTMLPIPGTSSPEHLEENWAAQDIALTPAEIAAISDARG